MTQHETLMALVSAYVSEYPNDTCGAKEKAALSAALEAVVQDADRYRWLRRTQMELGLPAPTVTMLVGDVTELDAARKEQP